MTDQDAVTVATWAIHNERVYHAGGNPCTCKAPPDWDVRAASRALAAIRHSLIDGDPGRLEVALRAVLDDEEAADAVLVVAELLGGGTDA